MTRTELQKINKTSIFGLDKRNELHHSAANLVVHPA